MNIYIYTLNYNTKIYTQRNQTRNLDFLLKGHGMVLILFQLILTCKNKTAIENNAFTKKKYMAKSSTELLNNKIKISTYFYSEHLHHI